MRITYPVPQGDACELSHQHALLACDGGVSSACGLAFAVLVTHVNAGYVPHNRTLRKLVACYTAASACCAAATAVRGLCAEARLKVRGLLSGSCATKDSEQLSK